MDDVLLGDADAVGQHLGDDGDMAGALEFAAFVPNQQRPRFRLLAAAVGIGLQRQQGIVDHLAQETQREDFVSHADISEDHAVIEVEVAAGELDALPFVAHVFVAEVTAVGSIVGKLALVGAVIVGRIDGDAARRVTKQAAERVIGMDIGGFFRAGFGHGNGRLS